MKKIVAALGLLLAVSGCASSPEPAYYTLAAVPGKAVAGENAIIKINTPSIAGYFDRLEFVRQDGDYRIDIDDAHHWAAPIDEMLARVLASDLQQRLPASLIMTSDAATSVTPRFVVALTLDHFNATDGGKVVLQGALTLTDKNSEAPPHVIPVSFDTETGNAPASIVAGLSRLTALAADITVQQLTACRSKPVP